MECCSKMPTHVYVMVSDTLDFKDWSDQTKETIWKQIPLSTGFLICRLVELKTGIENTVSAFGGQIWGFLLFSGDKFSILLRGRILIVDRGLKYFSCQHSTGSNAILSSFSKFENNNNKIFLSFQMTRYWLSPSYSVVALSRVSRPDPHKVESK